MRNFRTLDQAQDDLQRIQDYIDLIKNYRPKNVTQEVIYAYCLTGNVKRTAELLHAKGLRLDGNSISPRDISNIITSKPNTNDLLHKQVRTLYLKKTRSHRRVSVVGDFW